MYSIYPWKHLKMHHFASQSTKKIPGLVACTAKKASYAPGRPSVDGCKHSIYILVQGNDENLTGTIAILINFFKSDFYFCHQSRQHLISIYMVDFCRLLATFESSENVIVIFWWSEIKVKMHFLYCTYIISILKCFVVNQDLFTNNCFLLGIFTTVSTLIFFFNSMIVTILLKISENEVAFRVVVFLDNNTTRGSSYAHVLWFEPVLHMHNSSRWKKL